MAPFYDEPEYVCIQGTLLATTPKAVLLVIDRIDGAQSYHAGEEQWFPRQDIVLATRARRGDYVDLEVTLQYLQSEGLI